MVERKTEEDWTSERVARFWRYYAARTDLLPTYFSLQLGAGMTRFLEQAGLLHGEVLDYGCGPGFLCEALLAAGVRCTGCDSSESAVAATAKRLAGKPGFAGAFVSTDRQAPFWSRRFDLVTCIETVEHLPPAIRRAVLGDIASLLTDDGALFITTPNEEELGHAMHYCPFCDAEFHSMQHVRAFNRESLRATLEEDGFRVLYAGAVDFAEIQAPLVPRLFDLSPRLALRSARNLAFRTYDRLAHRRFPSRFEHARAGAKFPHLVAVAQKRGGSR